MRPLGGEPQPRQCVLSVFTMQWSEFYSFFLSFMLKCENQSLALFITEWDLKNQIERYFISHLTIKYVDLQGKLRNSQRKEWN